MLAKPHSSIPNRMVALILFGKRSLTLVLTLLLFFSGKLYPISVLSNFGCKNCPLDLIIANSRAFEIRLEREKFDTCQKITAAFSFDLATRSRLNHFCLSFPFNKLLFFFFLLSFCQQTILVTTGKASQQKFLSPLIVIFLLSACYRMDLFLPSLI